MEPAQHGNSHLPGALPALSPVGPGPRIFYVANTDWYLFNFQLDVARRVSAAGGEVVMVCPDGPYRARLQAEGFRWLELRMRRPIAPFADLVSLLGWIRLYRRERPALVHHFTTKCIVYGTLAARVANLPAIVNTVNGLGFVFGSRQLRARLIRPVLGFAMRRALGAARVRVLFQNRDDRDSFVRQGVLKGRRCELVAGSGVDTARFRPRQRPRSGTVRALIACRLLRDKGVEEFVQAARALRAEGLAIRFTVAGASDPGNPNAVPQTALERWRREDGIEILGHVENMDHLLRQVDVVVLPTAYREGAPRILLEAAACGLPIITSDTPGCRDLVTHGVNGLLVPARNAPAIADALRQLTGDEVLRRRLGEAGRARATEQFDVASVAETVIGVYRDALEHGHRRREPILKRPFDAIVSGLGLLALSPVWVAAAMAIKIEDGGPVFFRQTRWGRDGSHFQVLKFRTMVPDAEHAGPVPVQENDPRVTRVGRLLRATAMDELPQLWSIFRGQMSIVGPRPLAVGEVLPDGTRYEAVLGFDHRLSVRPGLTSPAAIYLPKDARPRHKFRYDSLYIRRQSFWLDVRLILFSFWITLRGRWESKASTGPEPEG